MLTTFSDFDRMFRTMNLLRNSLDGALSDFDRPGQYVGSWGLDQAMPRTNLYDKGGKFEIVAEVPGFAKEDLNVKIQGNYLELSGNRKSDTPEGYSTHRVERKTISFTRSFTLPSEVNADGAEAMLQNGLLRLSLPKSAAAVPRQIDIG
jgi:HSP20 family protein